MPSRVVPRQGWATPSICGDPSESQGGNAGGGQSSDASKSKSGNTGESQTSNPSESQSCDAGEGQGGYFLLV
ncbi:hypothetical protein GCM10010412_034850 [Nonomuraea recticatena]|uniref:Uncharacterized protein n=1 Tax=Nonomuraea recticatena TaxID=46178 RepID=A0ABN3RVC7_9ACTN